MWLLTMLIFSCWPLKLQWTYSIASLVPRPSCPSVCCSTNMGEGLVNWVMCNDVPGRVEEWHIPSVQWLSEPKKRQQDCLMSSAQSFYSPCLCSGSTLTYLLFFRECATPPHIQVRHCTWLSFTRPSPTLVLQATNSGVRRPGYKAIP